jgi:hypothetical protein
LRAVCVSGSRGWVPDVVKPGIHCARTHWIRGFMAFHWVPAPGARAGRERGQAGSEGSRAAKPGGEHGRDRGSAYGMMWEKGGVWGLGVI